MHLYRSIGFDAFDQRVSARTFQFVYAKPMSVDVPSNGAPGKQLPATAPCWASMSCHSFLLGSRVGEASNPGPGNRQIPDIQICVFNPTALHGKTEDVLEMGSDVYFVSETSATDYAQKILSRDFDKARVKCFWSPAAPDKFATEDGRPSLRGDALGCAILSRIQSRAYRGHVPPVLTETCRFSCAVIQLQNLEFLAITVYGFPSSTLAVKRQNDLLVGLAYQVAVESGLPFIIAGDFNTPVHELPIYAHIAEAGHVEIFSWYESKGWTLPPTCKGSTKNDTCILHRDLAQRVSDVQVRQNPAFDAHSPMFVTLDLQAHVCPRIPWKVPTSWADFDILPENLSSMYSFASANLQQSIDSICSAETGEAALVAWSKSVEKAVDRSLQVQHVMDPVRHPSKCLPDHAKGRCQGLDFRSQKSSAVKNDKFGGYNPSGEIFKMCNKLKIKQVRRIKSLIRTIEAFHKRCPNQDIYSDPDVYRQLQGEWDNICRAKGFGTSWRSWVLSFEAFNVVPDYVPILDMLYEFDQITVFACEASCNQEASLRRKYFRSCIAVDEADNFGSMSYRIIKSKDSKKLSEVPFEKNASVSMLRSSKGPAKYKVSNRTVFLVGQPASLQSVPVKIIASCEDFVFLEPIEGKLPPQGVLRQHFTAVSPDHISEAFNAFWEPFWLRDSYESQFDMSEWADFQQELDNCDFPRWELSIDIKDPNNWKRAIKTLKAGKAEGVCGWRYQEFHQLPDLAIEHLANIFCNLWEYGLTTKLMMARVCLLEKCQFPKSMADARPITILPCIYRLASKVVFQQVIDKWSRMMPSQVSGGISGRGVRDLSIVQTVTVENAVKKKEFLCGSTMDLAKAFNLIPRFPAAVLMNRLGMPWWCLHFWLRSLSNMSRSPTIGGAMGISIASTTGVPEGDVWSILAMLAISALFFFRNLTPRVTPFAYADNWAWLSKTTKDNFDAWIKTLNMVAALRMIVSVSKSWIWVTNSKWVEHLKTVNLLFPSQTESIPVLEHAKDLGEIIQYNKACFSRPLIERVDEAVSRIERLKKLPLNIEQKAIRIQTGIWSFGLYAADTHYVGMKHFSRLRRAAANALLGGFHHINPYIACIGISKYLMDPLLHVIIVALRSLRRLFSLDQDIAWLFVQLVSTFDAKWAYGPASSLSNYLDKVGLKLSGDAILQSEDDEMCDIKSMSCREIKLFMINYWNRYAFQHFIQRKGTPSDIVNINLQLSVFSKLQLAEQKMIALNITGGFQTNAMKGKWNEDVQMQCDHCDQIDSRSHRLIECEALSHIRENFPQALDVLSNSRSDWQFLPIVTFHEEYAFFQQVVESFKLPFDCPAPNVSQKNHVYFTDGGCIHPATSEARLASWSVVRDFAEDSKHAMAMTSIAVQMKNPCPLLRPVDMGLVEGRQTISRGELCAVIMACENALMDPMMEKTEIFSDSQYVVNVVHFLELGNITRWGYKIANYTLVSRLQKSWITGKFKIHKVKSHVDWAASESGQPIRVSMGNFVADRVATLALKRSPKWLRDLSTEMVKRSKDEKHRLEEVFQYLIELNREHKKIVSIKKDVTAPSQDVRASRNLMCDDAVRAMNAYAFPDGRVVKVDSLDSEALQGSLQGVNLARYILSWAETLQWPPIDHDWGDNEIGKTVMGWGISWFELFINFLLVTGQHCPVRVAGSLDKVQYTTYFSETARILPSDKRSAMTQCTAFQSAFRCVESILGTKLMPSDIGKGGKSVHRFGFTGQIASLAVRPLMSRQYETNEAVYHYIKTVPTKNKLRLPLDRVQSFRDIILDVVPEPTPEKRFKNYKMIYKRRCQP